MNTPHQDNRCHECRKLFCCATCRDLHEKKKHPRPKSDVDCMLCSREKLPLEKINDPNFLCHLVIRHLPLICVLCGQLYRSISDLENFSKCDYWFLQRQRRQSLLQDSTSKLTAQTSPSPIVKSISCPAASYQKDSPDSEFHTLQSFTSPPELIRHTSTPMHVGISGQKSKPQFKTPNKIPALFIKTPKTPTAAASAKNKSTPINQTFGNETIDKDPSPYLFYSATSQLLISKEVNSDNTPFGSTNSGSRSHISGDTSSRSNVGTTPSRLSEEVSAGYSREFFRTNSARILEVMEEQEEQPSIEMDLTKPQDNLDAVSVSDSPDPPPPCSSSIGEPGKDAAKKVRFSDQHQFMAAESTVDHVSDSEEFYEAREIPAEKSIANDKSKAQMMQENEDNSDKENLERPEESKVFKAQSPPSAPAATSSRLVMMVVVENGFDISTSSLVPLISSSLQKLEQNPLTESMTSSMPRISNQMQSTPNGTLRSVSSVDSYTASSTLDYFSTEVTPNSTIPHSQGAGVSSAASTGNSGGGIFSAVAQAMRYAFRGLPGAGSSKSSLENFGVRQAPGSSSNGLRTSPSSFSTIATSLLRRPGKRSRDPMNDAVFAHRRELRSPRNDSGSISPVAKRPRSWHKIRGRDPIARMRRDTPPTTSTRGVSSETQHFQQGSLSAGDTVIPLPSRAHQSTQTD